LSNRSGSPYSAPTDADRRPVALGVSTVDGITPVPLEVNPSTGQLQVSSSGGGGGTQYTDGAAAVTHPIGTQEVFTNGSGIVTAVSTANPLPITGTISVGSTTDESAFTAGTSTTGPIAGVFNDSVATLTSGQQGTIRSTTNRGLHTNLRNASGTEIGTASTPIQVSLANTATNSTAVKVDGSGVTQPISGTVTANAGTNLNTSALALETGGNLATIATNTGKSATSANQTNGTQQTKLTDGTNVANVLSQSATSTNFGNSQLIAPSMQTNTFSVTAVQAGTTYDVGNYMSVSVQITSQYTGTSPTITAQSSHDGTNWFNQVLVQASGGTTQGSATFTTTGLFQGNLAGRYFRLNFTGAYSSGTAAGFIVFKTQPTPPASMGISGNVGGGNATGGSVPTNAFYMAVNNASGNLTGLRVADADGLAASILGVLPMGYNGSTDDRLRTVGGAGSSGATTGVLVTSLTPVVNNNGLLKSQVIAAASTNATSVKASAGNIYNIEATNSDTVGYYLKFYNKASAPTVGTDTVVATYYVPPGGGIVINKTLGSPYTTGIALATTLLATNADTTVVTNANKLVINIEYI